MVVASLAATLLTNPSNSAIFCRDANHVVVPGAPTDFAAQRLDLGAQAGGFQRILYRDRQLVEVERLADEVIGAQLERRFDVFQLRVGGDHDDRARVTGFLELFQDVDAAGVGQAHV